MIHKYSEIFCWKNVSSFCSAKATHIFSAKNIRILCIESARRVNEMTLNELVKLTTLWTTGPRFVHCQHLMHATFFLTTGCNMNAISLCPWSVDVVVHHLEMIRITLILKKTEKSFAFFFFFFFLLSADYVLNWQTLYLFMPEYLQWTFP